MAFSLEQKQREFTPGGSVKPVLVRINLSKYTGAGLHLSTAPVCKGQHNTPVNSWAVLMYA